MSEFTVLWITLPLMIGFSIYLLPQTARLLTLGIALLSGAYAAALFSRSAPLDLRLLDSFGVALWADQLSAWFILTNALVTAAVLIYCWDRPKTEFFYTQLIKALGLLGAGWLVYGLLRRPGGLALPSGPEVFEHLLGGMGVMLIVLFWMVWSWSII